jgi:ATP-dependent Clp protease adapter protein ClpS/Zn-dependent protease
MVLVVLLAACVVIGCLLYLPFFLWFRRSKPRTGALWAERTNYTPVGYVLIFGHVTAMFAGLLFSDVNPASGMGTLLHGNAGMLKWLGCVIVVFTVIGGLLVRAGVAIQKPATTQAATAEAAPAPVPAAAKRPSGFHVATLAGVPIFVHGSYLLGGLFIALIAGGGVEATIGYCIGYAALFAIHEFGHAAVARSLGIRVYSVDLSGIGGLCRLRVPRTTRHTLLVYSAGLAAQALLLLLTMSAVSVFGAPQSHAVAAIVTTFTWVNALVFLINLIPGQTYHGQRTDGSVLWALYLHAFRGAAHPLAALQAVSPLFDPATSLLAREGLKPEGFTTGIEMLNDDTTPMEFVVQMLEQHGGLAQDAAIAAMVQIHQRGGMLLPLPDRMAAEAVAAAIARDARAQGRTLVCRAVSVGD